MMIRHISLPLLHKGIKAREQIFQKAVPGPLVVPKRCCRTISNLKGKVRREFLPTFRDKSPKTASISSIRHGRIPTEVCSAIFYRHHFPPQASLLLQKSPKPFPQKSLIKESQIPSTKPS